MKILLFLFSFALALTMNLSEALAQSDSQNNDQKKLPPGKIVSPIQVSGLGNFRGKYLTAIYAIGSMSTFVTQQNQVTLRIVKGNNTKQIDGDVIQLPASQLLAWNGVVMPYNLVVLVVHDLPEFAWVNADGSVPENSDVKKYHAPLLVNSLRSQAIDKIQLASGFQGVIIHQMSF